MVTSYRGMLCDFVGRLYRRLDASTGGWLEGIILRSDDDEEDALFSPTKRLTAAIEDPLFEQEDELMKENDDED